MTPRSYIFANSLAETCAGLLQGVRDVEGSQSPERADAARGDGDRGSVCNGVGVDDVWEHQPVCEHASGHESVRAREFSLRASTISVCP